MGFLVAYELGEIGTGPCSFDFWNLARHPSSRSTSGHLPSVVADESHLVPWNSRFLREGLIWDRRSQKLHILNVGFCNFKNVTGGSDIPLFNSRGESKFRMWDLKECELLSDSNEGIQERKVYRKGNIRDEF